MSANTELRLNLLWEIYQYYVNNQGEAKPVLLDAPRGKLTLAYKYLSKRNLIELNINEDTSSGIARISLQGIDLLIKRNT